MPLLPADGPNRWDLQLLFIGVSLIAGLLVALLSPLSIAVGAGIGSVVASLGVVDGLALHPPVEE